MLQVLISYSINVCAASAGCSIWYLVRPEAKTEDSFVIYLILFWGSKIHFYKAIVYALLAVLY